MFIFRIFAHILQRLFRFIYFLGGAAALVLILLLITEGALAVLKLPPDGPLAKQSYVASALADGHPSDRDVHLYIRPSAIRELALLYTNLKLSPQWYPFTKIGPEPTLAAVTVNSDIGQMRASADVVFWNMTLAVDLSIEFDRIEVQRHLKLENGKHVDDPKDDDCDIVFVPHIDRIRLTGLAHSLSNLLLPRLTNFSEHALGVIADQQLNWIREDDSYRVELPIKVPRRVVLPVKLSTDDETTFRALKTKKSDDEAPIIGSLKTHTELKETKPIAFFNFGAPLISPTGIWIFATVQFEEPKWLTREDARRLLSSDSPSAAQQASINDLAKLADKVPNDASLELEIKTTAFMGLVDELKRLLDAPHRTVEISTIESKGEIFRLQAKDDNVLILEAFKLFADIPQDRSVQAKIAFDKVTGKITSQGIELSTTATGTAKASVRVTAEALSLQQPIFTHDFSASLTNVPLRFRLYAFPATKTIKDTEYKAAFWGLDAYCSTTVVEFKMGSGKIGDTLPITFDSFEVDIPTRLFKEKSRASLILSSLPSRQPLVRLPEESDKEKGERTKTGWSAFVAQYSKPPFLLVPPSKGLEITVSPTEVTISDVAYRIDAALKFNTAPEPKLSEEEKKQREDILNAIKDTRFPGAQACGPDLPSVTFKNLGLGPAAKLWDALLKVAQAAKAQGDVEKARLRLAVAILQGKDISSETQQLLQKELTNLGVQFDASKAVVGASIANAEAAIDDAKRKAEAAIDDAKKKKKELEDAALKKGDQVTPKGLPKPSEVRRRCGRYCP